MVHRIVDLTLGISMDYLESQEFRESRRDPSWNQLNLEEQR